MGKDYRKTVRSLLVTPRHGTHRVKVRRLPDCLVVETAEPIELAYASFDELRPSLTAGLPQSLSRTITAIVNTSLILVASDYSVLNAVRRVRAATSLLTSQQYIQDVQQIANSLGLEQARVVSLLDFAFRSIADQMQHMAKTWSVEKEIEAWAESALRYTNKLLSIGPLKGRLMTGGLVDIGLLPHEARDQGNHGECDIVTGDVRVRLELKDGYVSRWTRMFTVFHEMVHKALLPCLNEEKLQMDKFFVEGLANYLALEIVKRKDGESSITKFLAKEFLPNLPIDYTRGFEAVQTYLGIGGRGLIADLLSLDPGRVSEFDSRLQPILQKRPNETKRAARSCYFPYSKTSFSCFTAVLDHKT